VNLQTADFDFKLPEALIASHPPINRDGGRLLVLDPSNGRTEHCRVTDLPSRLPPGAVLVVNDTRVIKARLKGHRPTGGAVEVLLIRPIETDACSCRFTVLLKANRPLKIGDTVDISGVSAKILDKRDRGEADVEMDVPLTRFMQHVETHGAVPLPPYIRRAPNLEDAERYQTVYAEKAGSVAAPTAGLHFTPTLLDEIRQNGVTVVKVTLHVGPGTFRPISTDSLGDHKMDKEAYHLSEETVAILNAAKTEGRPIIAVGTTVTRALEGAFAAKEELLPSEGFTDLFITPGYEFKVIDGLLTNFHLPKSTLIALVSALAGREQVLFAYREAIEKRYRFYSYGDAMLIPPRRQ
jgi:S-adenosylmethionine:tRNA ribosyltransferase-isomerase